MLRLATAAAAGRCSNRRSSASAAAGVTANQQLTYLPRQVAPLLGKPLLLRQVRLLVLAHVGHPRLPALRMGGPWALRMGIAHGQANTWGRMTHRVRRGQLM